MIEVEKYKLAAAKAADAMREALLAVEACGADVELTNIVVRLSSDRDLICRLFGLPSEQAFQVKRLTDG